MDLVSVVIPARNEKYLQTTLDSLYANAGTEIEVVVVLDGPTEYPLVKDYPGLTVIDNPVPQGVRVSINRGVEVSRGNCILKLDAHCIVGEDFVNVLRQDIDDNWVMVARRYTLDLETMTRQPRIVDYYYLSCPWTHPKSFMMQSCPWITRTEQRMGASPIDDLMCFQGSMWFTTRQHWERIGGLDETNGEIYAEHHEISMKTWSIDGRVAINKQAWYAHPRKDTRGYHMSMGTVYRDHDHSARYWTGQWTFFCWLMDKFWPLPTESNRHRTEKYYWPEDWREKFWPL